MKNLEGKVAIVTGGSRGIGAAIAQRLAEDGASVVVNYRSQKDQADTVVQRIRDAGGEAIAVQADMTDQEQLTRLFQKADDAFGRLDILVNNAGVGASAPIDEITAEHVDHLYTVNVRAILLAAREAVSRFDETGGRIVNLSSVVADTPAPASTAYAATKAAVQAITKSLAAELGPRNVTVNAVAPGPVVTDMLREAGFLEHSDQLIEQTPLGRLGQPEDVAGVVAFLASGDGGWLTGQTLQASGGLHF
jgi:3-oxoacyl-[acyl-carrier protein] reductase